MRIGPGFANCPQQHFQICGIVGFFLASLPGLGGPRMRATKYVPLALLLILSLTLLLHGNLPQISSGTWTPANNLTEARSGSAAVVLDDGRVLFTGGTGSTGPLASAE